MLRWPHLPRTELQAPFPCGFPRPDQWGEGRAGSPEQAGMGLGPVAERW